MKHLEHIGIAVKSLADSIPVFEKLLNTNCYRTEEVKAEHVTTAFFHVGETKIELLQGEGENGPIQKFIDRRGEGLHHLAFEVEDIVAEMDRLKNAGFVLLNDAPTPGADNKLICFLHPKNTNGVLVELCQEIP